jgi:serine/threonine-protein kinase
MTASGLTSDSPPDGRDVHGGADGITVGSVIADYRLEEQIGHGGMAVVFRGRDERLRRQVAVKILAPALGADRAFRRRFVRESRAAALVDDPHIIPIYQAGESGGFLFIAMRLVNGGDVRTLLRHHGPLPPARAAALLSPVASALDAAHAAGLVHRDVKPANMLLDVRPGRPDHVYLSDFGLSKRILSSPGLTGEGIFVGTPYYVAPEQVTGGRRVDGRADQYSLACAAFELLSGVVPFQGEHAMAVIHAQAFEQPPLLTTLRPGLPPTVDAVLAKALAKAPAERYATCWDFAEALRAALGLPPYAGEPAARPGPDRSGPEAGSRTADPAGPDEARTEEPGTRVAAGRTAKRRAAGRHRKRGLRLAAAAITVASLLAGAIGATMDLSGHAGGQQGRHPHATSAEPLAPVVGSLQGITAVAARSTWTMGGGCTLACLQVTFTAPPLIARWDGISWFRITNPVSDARLTAAAAGPAGSVWLVGYSCMTGCGGPAEVDKTLIMHWDGHDLAQSPSPSPGPGRLASMTTGPGGTAYAVGYYCRSGCGGQSEVDRTLVLSWAHGRWSWLRSASAGAKARLAGVSAGPSGDVWAVGSYCVSGCGTFGEIDHILIVRPSADGWSSVAVPSPGVNAQLSGVSAGADGTAWAVGRDAAGAVITRWDAHHWRPVASPDPGAKGQLDSVSTGRGGTAWAVGSYCASGCNNPLLQAARTLIVQWSARGWRVVPSPESAGGGRLLSVSAGPDGTAWAAGYTCVSKCDSPLQTDRTLILRWQGTRWIAG